MGVGPQGSGQPIPTGFAGYSSPSLESHTFGSPRVELHTGSLNSMESWWQLCPATPLDIALSLALGSGPNPTALLNFDLEGTLYTLLIINGKEQTFAKS